MWNIIELANNREFGNGLFALSLESWVDEVGTEGETLSVDYTLNS